MKIPLINWTDDMLKLLYNTNYGCREVAEKLNLRVGSVYNKRKSLNIKNNQSAVMSKPRPQRYKKETRVCVANNCNNAFVVVPSRTKIFCSHSCDTRTNHRAPKGIGSRSIRNPNINEYKRYARKVHKLSDNIYKENIETINPNNYPRTLCGVENGWQLDHIKPIKECFEADMSIEGAANLQNLRMLPWKTNLMRQYIDN